MGMQLMRESITILPPPSEIKTKNRLVSNTMQDKEVGGFYTNDDEKISKDIKDFFENFSKPFIIPANKINDFEKSVKQLYEFSHEFRDNLNDFKTAISFFTKENKQIHSLFFSKKSKRYLKFDNNDNVSQMLYDTLLGSKLTYLIIEKHENKFEIYPKFNVNKFNEVFKNYSKTDQNKIKGRNEIYFGVPGSGKSYTIKKIYEQNDNLIVRTTFHPDYSHADFIGQILPIVNNNEVKYDFIPGPFTKALKTAIEFPLRHVILIIEEINRGNASAIFGDIFQLLDRDDFGNSEYIITNIHMQEHLNINYISIPYNLSIVASMNTSDQNVFTLDTAFKRRWNLKYVKNKFTNKNYLKDLYIPKSNYLTWEGFVTRINRFITRSQQETINAEDKKLGVYFASSNDLVKQENLDDANAAKRFAENVLMYIWEDVAKLNRTDWFNEKASQSLDSLFDTYLKEGLEQVLTENIFNTYE